MQGSERQMMIENDDLRAKSHRRRSRKGALVASQKRAKRRFQACLLAACGVAVSLAGCTRQSYRQRADLETNYLIAEKAAHAAQPVPRSVDLDPRSRMFDPFNPDREPMPEDDPRSHEYMQIIDGKRHYPLWYANGKTNTAENPTWYEYLPLDERGVLVMDAQCAIQLALLHSPSFQQNVETLYLSALDVSSERFLFDNQFFGGYSLDLTTDGRNRGGAFGDSRTNFTPSTFSRGRRPFALQRRFSTGADLLVGFANSLTWQLSGPNTQSANTILDFSLIQPLLRQAGRDVVLERLTLAERTLLANMRAFERYRRGFSLEILIGRNSEQGPSRRGGLFGGAGLEGFTGLGGGFGRVGGGGFGGFAGVGGVGVPGAGGYLGLLQNQLEIRNLEENVARNRENLLRFEETLRELLTTIPDTQDTIPSQQLQVAQSRQALISAQSNLLNSKTSYEQTLDLFKRTLGLPPYLCVEIRDSQLDQFNLISNELRERRDDVADLRDSFGQSNTQLLNLSTIGQDEETGERFRKIQLSRQVQSILAQIESKTAGVEQVQQTIANRDLPQVEADLKRLGSTLPTRSQQLSKLGDIFEAERELICTLLPASQVDPGLFDPANLDGLPNELEKEYARIRDKLAAYEGELTELRANIATLKTQSTAEADRTSFDNIRDQVILKSQDLLSGMAEDVLALQVLQARARTEAVILPEVDLTPRQAVDIARTNRLDWMNARASLVDAWRAIEVVADDLESSLDVVFSGDVQNFGDNPLNLRSSTGRLRVGLQWDAPLNRLRERNNYRQVLIEYQQARRSYYQFEDAVWLTLRSQLRNLRFNQINFELQRYAVRVAAEQITLNEDLRQIRESQNQASGPTAARDSVSALQDLLQAQNTFLGVWVFYEVQRQNLDQDLGTLRLDECGNWLDPGPISMNNYFNTSQDATLQQEMGLGEGGEITLDGSTFNDATSTLKLPNDLLTETERLDRFQDDLSLQGNEFTEFPVGYESPSGSPPYGISVDSDVTIAPNVGTMHQRNGQPVDGATTEVTPRLRFD